MSKAIHNIILFAVLSASSVFAAEASRPKSKLNPNDFLECSVTYFTYLYVLQEGEYKNKDKLAAIKELALMSGSIAQSLSSSNIEADFKNKLTTNLAKTRKEILGQGLNHYLSHAEPKMKSCDSLIQSNGREIYEILYKRN